MSITALIPTPDFIVLHVLECIRPLELSETNGNFQRLVVERLLATGQSVDDLTVRQVRDIINTAASDYFHEDRRFEKLQSTS